MLCFEHLSCLLLNKRMADFTCPLCGERRKVTARRHRAPNAGSACLARRPRRAASTTQQSFSRRSWTGFCRRGPGRDGDACANLPAPRFAVLGTLACGARMRRSAPRRVRRRNMAWPRRRDVCRLHKRPCRRLAFGKKRARSGAARLLFQPAHAPGRVS